MPNGMSIEVPFTKSSIVIVGENLPPEMVDRSSVFGGDIDEGSLVLAGPLLHCTYQQSQFSVSAIPNRVDLRVHELDEPIPGILHQAGNSVISFLAQNIPGATISGLAFNYENVVELTDDSNEPKGEAFCQRVFDDDFFQTISGLNLSTVVPFAHFGWLVEPIRMMLRIEPESSSRGQNLFVAVAGFQELSEENPLKSAMSHITEFKQLTEEIYARINSFISQSQ